MKSIIFTLLLLVACNKNDALAPNPQKPTPQPDNGQVGNGGAGVCIAGQCSTLTEVGLRIPGPEEEFYSPPPELAQKIAQIAAKLPLGNRREKFVADTIGQGQNFVIVEISDATLLEPIREQYAEILAKYNDTIDPQDVSIFAFADADSDTDAGRTYLLPTFFQLSLEQQAKILIHERNVRGRLARYSWDTDHTFEIALELDGYIQDLLVKPSLWKQSDFRIDRWIKITWDYYSRGYSDNTGLALWLEWLRVNQSIIFETPKVFKTGDSFSLSVARISQHYLVPPAFLRFVDKFSNTLHFEYRPAKIFTDEQYLNICRQNLKDQSYVSILYPYVSNAEGDYNFLRLACLVKEGAISYEAFEAYAL
jgi:hypothetical protein